METQQQQASPIEVGIRYGLVLAAASVLVDFLTRIVGLSVLVYGIVAGVLLVVLSTVGVVLAHKAFRQANKGTITYVQGMVIALVMLLISSLVAAVFNYLYVNYIDPDFVGRMKDDMVAFMERRRIPEAQIAASTAQFAEMNPTPLKALYNGARGGLIWGTVLGALISVFTKRKPADFD